MFFRFVLVEYKVIAIIVELVNENYEHQSCKKSVFFFILINSGVVIYINLFWYYRFDVTSFSYC